MKQDVNPLVAVLVIAVALLFIGFIFNANQRSAQTPRPGLMATHPDGGVALLVGNELFKLNPKNHDETVYHLDQWGIQSTIGGFAFFRNGDLLLQPRTLDAGVAEKLSTYLRRQNDNYAPATDSPLLRCTPDAGSCTIFSKTLPRFNRTFRPIVDWRTDSVYIADTSRHRLIKLDGSGNQLAVKSGFKFPNQLRFVGTELWLADTNHNRVVRISDDNESFGKVLAEHRMSFGALKWPSDILWTGGEWWVLVMNNDMRDGRIFRFDDTWKRLGKLPLPRSPDPLAMQPFGNDAIVDDADRFAVYYFNPRGERLADKPYPQLQSTLAKQAAEYRRTKWQVTGLWSVFALLIVAGIVYGFRQIPKTGLEPIAVNNGHLPAPGEIPDSGIEVKPVAAIRWAAPAMAALLLLQLVATALLSLQHKGQGPTPVALLSSLLLLTLALSAIIYPLFRFSRYRLHFYPEHLVFTDYNGFRHQQPYSEILWSEGSFRIGSHVLPFPYNGRGKIFPSGTMKKLLVPRLSGERHINKWTMFRHQWQSPDGLLKSIAAMLCLMGLAAAWLQLYPLFSG